ncbi:LemA family protein [uncultured archaeon]|nr:LemA family protein [uncultured archaeon]
MIEVIGFLGMILVGLVIVALLASLLLYNTLVSKKNQVESSFSSIDVLLKKRYDLIPNLIATVKAYMKHEADTLTNITELRAKAISGKLTDNEKIEVNNKLSGFMRSIFVAVENYPNLKANENFLQLQASFNEVEEQISAARRAYNAAVLDYNNAVMMFPTNVLASILNYQKKPFFEVPEEERQRIDAAKLFGQTGK